MTKTGDISQDLVEQVKQAFDRKTAIRISAGNSKLFYGNAVSGDTLDIRPHVGIIDYRPSELVITARAGSQLADIENELASNGQQFAFEPLQHSDASTLGGVIACGLSGPRRGFGFAVRDAVLGASIINGRGDQLHFGGQVMKNVAGYDTSRLMVGAQGSLGILLDISIKVKPLAESELTLVFEIDYESAQSNLKQWVMQGLPVSSSCYHLGNLHIRLSSTAGNTRKAQQLMGGETGDNDLWNRLKQQTHPFFTQYHNLWRVSVPPSTPLFSNKQPQLIEWGGGLRWIESEQDMYSIAAQHDGHATLYRLQDAATHEDIFQPLATPVFNLHRRIKQSFDPENILNPGRLYREL